MKFLLIGLLAVQIASVSCTNRRKQGSYFLRKMCVEVSGLKGKVAGLEEELSGLKEENLDMEEKVAGLVEELSGFKEENLGLEEKVAGLEEELSGLKEENLGLEEKVAGLEEELSGLKEENLDMEEKVAGLVEELSGFKEENLGLEEKVAGLEEELSGLKEENLGLEEKVTGLEEEVAAMRQAVDGNWAGWMQWSGCSNNCGSGTMTRQRQCLDPRPSNGGSDCLGAASETEDCEVTGCKDPYSAFAIYDEVPYYHNGVLIWDETELNITPNNAAHYNTSSGKYCAEFSGTYLFQLHLYKSSSTSGTAYCYIIKEWLLGYEARLARAYNDGSFEASTATIVNLAQGDCVYVGDCTGPTLITRQTSFSGALLHLLD